MSSGPTHIHPAARTDDVPFWKQKSLKDMSLDEWESLCDGCARCCLHKLEEEDTGQVYYTEVACSLLDIGSCHCKDYVNRTLLISDCVELTATNLSGLKWLPPSCAYRLLYEGKDLYWWHPLVSGDPDTVHQAGISVRGRAIAEENTNDIEDHIVDWPDQIPDSPPDIPKPGG
jgi:uncharacterized cysteine cluster protein YcgN (CxxCxxCC family)